MYKILKEWLPAEKIELEKEVKIEENEENEKINSDFLSELCKIDEINVETGLRRVSGMENMYRETVALFTQKIVQECNEMNNKVKHGDVSGFSISVHAMKSALSTIGAMSLSETALRLEMASKENDFDFCVQRFPAFRDKLLKLHEDLSAVFPDHTEIKSNRKSGNTAYLKEKIEKAIEAASDFDSDAGLNVINKLLAYDFGEQNNALLENAAAAFKDFNYDAVTELLHKIAY